MVQTRQELIHIAHEGAQRGEANMHRDLELLSLVESQTLRLAFRTYTWDPWALSLGKHQRPDSVDETAAKDLGIDVVQRPTGGRAVLHANELTYCIAVRHDHPRYVYAAVHEMLMAALQPLVGHRLDHETTPTDLRQHYASSTSVGQICFTSSAHSEILSGGRKIVGSAQRVFNGIILQHGSILCGPEHEGIAQLLNVSQEERRTVVNRLRSTSTSLSEIAGTAITIEHVATAVHQVAEEVLVRKLL